MVDAKTDRLIIGAGAIGLAIARQFALAGDQVLLIECNAGFGMETSSRNSEVIHAGIYYPAASHKARLCVRGAHKMYQYCASRGVKTSQHGKLIVATNQEQEARLDALMTAGMATVAGSVMVALISILEVQFENVNLIQHFLTASILSIPAAIMYANIMIPSNEITDSNDESSTKVYSSTMDAITSGTTQGSSIAVSVGTILIAVIALVYIVNAFLGTVGGYFGLDLSIELLLGYFFAPITWLMGIPWSEALVAGELLGLKTTLNEFVAYPALANLEPGLLSERSKLITFYSLCGFANFSSVGILISGIGAMVPERKNDLIEVSFKALVAATLASCMTGLVVGCFI